MDRGEAMRDSLGAFVPGEMIEKAGAAQGPLSGLTFAVKDLFDIAGRPTGAGNPNFARAHPSADRDAPLVARLLEAGARLAGKTVLDEFAYGMNGVNVHYGAPTNPNAPGRVTGGSSSGSASAVAGGLVDFALGTDTGGSVRVPASYCGLFGIRPSHGRLSLEGVVPLASSFDTVGWFARDANLLMRVGACLFAEAGREPAPRRLLIAEDAFRLMEPEAREALEPWVARMRGWFAEALPVDLAGPMESLEVLRELFRVIQGREAWAAHGAWLEEAQPQLNPDVAERFAQAAQITEADAAAAAARRDTYRAWLGDTLGDDGMLVLPSALGPAPALNRTGEDLSEWRLKTLQMSAAASLAGTCQVSLPLAEVAGLPQGLSLMAAPGADMTLLRFCERFQRLATGAETGPSL